VYAKIKPIFFSPKTHLYGIVTKNVNIFTGQASEKMPRKIQKEK
jgi:hypothetical protein